VADRAQRPHRTRSSEAKKVERLSRTTSSAWPPTPASSAGCACRTWRASRSSCAGAPPKGLHGEALIRAALQTRGDQGFNTTSDFSILLETAVNKIFVGQYALAPVTWPMWCGRKSVQDFRTSTFYRPGTFGVLDSGDRVRARSSTRTSRTARSGRSRRARRRTSSASRAARWRTMTSARSRTWHPASAWRPRSPSSPTRSRWSPRTAVSACPTTPTRCSTRAATNIGPTGAMSATTLDGRARRDGEAEGSVRSTSSSRCGRRSGSARRARRVAKQFNSSTTDPTDNKAQGVVQQGAEPVPRHRSTRRTCPRSRRPATTCSRTRALPGVRGRLHRRPGSAAHRDRADFGFDGIQMKVILDYGTAALDFRGAVTCAGV
jgi:hypothetical protein